MYSVHKDEDARKRAYVTNIIGRIAVLSSSDDETRRDVDELFDDFCAVKLPRVEIDREECAL